MHRVAQTKVLYPRYQKQNFPEFEEKILEFWEKNQVFEKSLEIRKSAPLFVFYEGPPSANGKPGIHHVMARTIKDLICRYKALKGFYVPRKAGWDTHGLPVELEVEKSLGITKQDIGKKISIEAYNAACKKAVMRYKDLWEQLTRRMGYWIDLKNPYITFTNEYIESVWYLLKQIYQKGWLYKGYTVQPYSPAAGTGLSSHELNLPGCYKIVKDISVVVQFELKRNETSEFLFDKADEKVYCLAWTTTPWTLPSNCALAVHPEITYVKIETLNPYHGNRISVILAKDCIERWFDKEMENAPWETFKKGERLPWQIVKTFSGEKLIGIRYHQLMPYVVNETLQQKAFRIIPGDFVTTDEGTGIVHTASIFGADDFKVCKKEGVPSVLVQDEEGNWVPLVDKQGRFRPEVTDFAGRGVKPEFDPPELLKQPDYKPVDLLIALKLKKEGKAFRIEKYEHPYPHCWRTDKPVLYYPLDSWFIKTTAVKERLVELNKTINWKPRSTGEGRFGNWLQNVDDWNLSRQRFWGIPLPIWRNKDGSEEKCIGSIAELKEEIQKAIACGVMEKDPFEDQPLDLHRPYIDKVVLADSQGRPMYREPDLIDVWFDSGAMPYAQWHYPFENQEWFQKFFPADFIAEGVDQTRGWFFTLHVIATMISDQPAFKNVIANGLVLDKDGNKMSKRLGNAVDPFLMMERYGADPLRWYMITNAPPWENLRFNEDHLKETVKKFFGTLFNTYQFFAIYANIDQFHYKQPLSPQQRGLLDRWILSRLQQLIKKVDTHLSDYDPTPAARAIQHFVIEELSNWYVRLSRRRFWKSEQNQDKEAAYQTLYEVLLTLAKLMAPFIPFTAEWLYKNLTDYQNPSVNSVHLQDFPQVQSQWEFPDLEEAMDLAQRITHLIHSLRKKHKVRVRQPLRKALVATAQRELLRHLETITPIVLKEVNIKTLEILPEDSPLLVKEVKPDYRKLGPKYQKRMPLVAKAISQMTNEEKQRLEKEGKIALTLEDGTTISLAKEEVIFVSKDIPGWEVASDGVVTVALDLQIDEALYQEGLIRDFINRVQHLRKELGLEVTDRISLYVEQQPILQKALQAFQSYVMQETLTTSLQIVEQLPQGKEVSVGDLKTRIFIEKT